MSSSSPSSVRSLPLKYQYKTMMTSNKRFKYSSPVKNPFWERTNDEESPRRRRMGGMAFHSSSSSCASSSPMASSSSIGPFSSPTMIPSSPLASSVSPISKNRRQQWLKRKVDWDEGEDDLDDVGSEVNGLELLLTAIERQHTLPFASPKAEPLQDKLEAVEEPETSVTGDKDGDIALDCQEAQPLPSETPIPHEPVPQAIPPSEILSPHDPLPKSEEVLPSSSEIEILPPAPAPLEDISLEASTSTKEILPSTPKTEDVPLPSEPSLPSKPSQLSVDTSSAESSSSSQPSQPSPQFSDDELTGQIITFLAFGPTSSSTAPNIVNQLLTGSTATRRPKKSKGKTKSKEEEEKRNAMLVQVRRVLDEGDMFGRIDRPGEDADGMPLESTYHYLPSKDPDQDRAATIAALGMKPKRRATIKHVQYHYAPVSLNRYELAAEIGDDG
ncbi:hypothetical protein FRC03_010083 [Tulasnella sp. 419]|nr:hypothetical protein FRC03_010083 [Tulasnella sp. 419]